MTAAAMLVPRCVPHRGGPPGPLPVQVPEGCLRDQSGEYRHAGNAAYRYRGRDDGETLVLVLEEGPADGGTRPAVAAAPHVVLDRTPHGFVGRTEAKAFAGSGQSCAVSFPTEVVSCADDALTLRAAMSAQVNELCQAPVPTPGTPAGAMLEHRLLRAPTAAPDGGAREPGRAPQDFPPPPSCGGRGGTLPALRGGWSHPARYEVPSPCP